MYKVIHSVKPDPYVPPEEPVKITGMPENLSPPVSFSAASAPALPALSTLHTESPCTVSEANRMDFIAHAKKSLIFLSVDQTDGNASTATGTIFTTDGYALTAAHVVRDARKISARVYTPGAVGGDYHWYPCRTCVSRTSCDIAIIKLDGANFPAAELRPGTVPVTVGEITELPGYPLGASLADGDRSMLEPSIYQGRISSIMQMRDGTTRIYVDSRGLHGNSGSPVYSHTDGRMIGVFSGAIVSGQYDEQNFFYPVSYVYELLGAANT